MAQDATTPQFTPGTILVGTSTGPCAPGHVNTPTRFKVMEDGRLRLQGTGRWVASMESVQANYGPLVPEAKK